MRHIEDLLSALIAATEDNATKIKELRQIVLDGQTTLEELIEEHKKDVPEEDNDYRLPMPEPDLSFLDLNHKQNDN